MAVSILFVNAIVDKMEWTTNERLLVWICCCIYIFIFFIISRTTFIQSIQKVVNNLCMYYKEMAVECFWKFIPAGDI